MSNLSDDGLTDQPSADTIDPTAEVEATDVEAQPETEGEAPPPEDEPQYEYVDPEALQGKYVRLIRNGEEISVPWEEATNLAQQGWDYTQKTQAVAEQRKEAEYALRLAQALQTNPGLTMQVLAQQAGMSVQEFLNLSPGQQQAVAEQASDDQAPEFDDPLERQLWEERQARLALERRIEQREADEELRYSVNGLKQQYGATEEDARAVVSAALNMGYGPQAFPMIYQAMQFQKMQVEQQTQQEHQQTRQAQEAQRRAAAAAASQQVSTGASANGTTRAVDPNQHMSIRDAFEMAWEEATQ